MATPRVLLLDVMGTLVYDPFYRELPAFFGMSLEELLEQKHPTAWVEYERGELDDQVFLDRFFRDGREYDQAGLLECMGSSYRWLDGMLDLVAGLHAAGQRMVALSNYSPWYRMIEAQVQLSRYVSWDFVSCETGLRKPDAGAYRHALTQLDLEPAECLFVDDREGNCRAARGVGLDALLFHDAGRLRRELGSYGLL